jgi:hypothetical protein
VRRREVTTVDDVERLGLRGSPTVLLDGVDPFAVPDSGTSPSCRLCRTENGPAGAFPLIPITAAPMRAIRRTNSGSSSPSESAAPNTVRRRASRSVRLSVCPRPVGQQASLHVRRESRIGDRTRGRVGRPAVLLTASVTRTWPVSDSDVHRRRRPRRSIAAPDLHTRRASVPVQRRGRLSTARSGAR